MSVLQRTTFARGWVPDADAVNGPVDGLLRMDNCVLDEAGVVALRLGSAKVNANPFADLDVHSLYTAIITGTRYRLAGAGSTLYNNGASLSSGFAGSGDLAFGSHLGQVLIARGSTRRKFDGASVRNWGVTPSAVAPTVAAVASDGKTFATCDLASAEFTVIEDDGTGITYAAGQDGAANGAVVLIPDPATHRGAIQKIFGGDTDFTAYDAGGVGTENDLIELYFYIDEPGALLAVTLMVDVNSGSTNRFQDDYYWHKWSQAEETSLAPAAQADIPTTLASSGQSGRVRGLLPAVGIAVPRNASTSTVRFDKPVGNAGWSRLRVRREDLTRVGSSSGKDWKTVKAIRLVVETIKPASTQFDAIRMVANPLNGRYRWLAVSVFNSGQYLGRSGPSPLSAEAQIQAQGADVTVTASADGQVSETWLYRMGGVLDAFYRVAVSNGNGGVIHDTLSDVDALVANIVLESDNTIAPANIVSIAGPYFDRVFALTSDGFLWPSRRLDPDAFATGQTIRATGPDEQPFWIRKAIGGLYLGTSKDVYLLEGDGAELPDGTINFTKRPLNIDHPPINDAVVQDGNLLIYCASDGWRAVSGAGSQSLVGDTSLLYRGQVRHGRGPVNLKTGRFRAAIGKGQLLALTPENTETTSSPRIYRHAPARGAWYYHSYPVFFRVVYREPDGTLLAGDINGTVWELDARPPFDSPTGDANTPIPITIWTTADGDGQPLARKDPIDLRVEALTVGGTLAVALHRNDAATPDLSVTGLSTNPAALSVASLTALGAAYRFQARFTGSFTQFRLGLWGLQHVVLPVPVNGHLPPSNFGDPRIKTLSGIQFRICTQGATRTLTPIGDGAALPPLTIATDVDEALDVTLTFARPIEVRALGLTTDGDTEIYGWSPLVSTRRPLGITSWDSGPIDLGRRELVWLRRLDIKVRPSDTLTVFVYLDGEVLTRVQVPVVAGVDTVIPIGLPRGCKGRQPRLLVTSPGVFSPYWIKVIERVTGQATEKTILTVPVAVEGVSA